LDFWLAQMLLAKTKFIKEICHLLGSFFKFNKT
jgi:hypothetical protein